MLQPINYSLNVKTPFEAAVEGYKVGLAGQESLAQRQALEAQRAKALADAEKISREAEEAAKNRAAAQAVYSNRKSTFEDYRGLAAMLPFDQQAGIMAQWEAMSKERQTQRLRQGAEVLSALSNNNPQAAIKTLTKQAEDDRAAGQEDAAKATESIIQTIGIDPDRARVAVGTSMSYIPGAERIINAASGDRTAFQQDYDFILKKFGKKAAAEFAQFGRSGVVSIPVGKDKLFVGPPSMAPGVDNWQDATQGIASSAPRPMQSRIDSILNKAMQSRRIDQATVDTLNQAFGPDGQARIKAWLGENSVRVVVRRGYDKSTGKSVIEFSDGKVEYGTD